jgi:hypothetical protein
MSSLGKQMGSTFSLKKTGRASRKSAKSYLLKNNKIDLLAVFGQIFQILGYYSPEILDAISKKSL